MTACVPARDLAGGAARRGPARRTPRGLRDRGSGTVLLVGVVAVVGALLAAVSLLAGAQRARATAQAAADLAALAAASALADPGGASPAEACAVASAVVARNDAVLVRCVPAASGVVTVTATRRVAAGGTARASARAGPATVRGGGP